MKITHYKSHKLETGSYRQIGYGGKGRNIRATVVTCPDGHEQTFGTRRHAMMWIDARASEQIACSAWCFANTSHD